MFFFFDFENEKVSSLAFETYVTETLQKYAEAQGKTLLLGGSNDAFDAFFPSGIDDIIEPIYVEIKYFDSGKKSLYFQNISKYINQLDKMDDSALLLILGDEFTEKSLEAMKRMFEAHTMKKVYIWTLSVFNKKTAGYRTEDFENLHNKNTFLVDRAINVRRSKEDERDAQESILSGLKQKYKNEEVVLFLGAGVSMDAGLPSWETLIERLLAKMISIFCKGEKINVENLNKIIELAHKNQDSSAITQMRYIRSALKTTEYNQLVKEALYANIADIQSELMDSISEICAPTRNHIGVQGIVTYNFDDLIERKLDSKNILNNAIYDELGCSVPEKLSIFHVHGYLPQINDEQETHELIFSEEDYHRIYRDAYSWSNIVQLNYLRERTCLFIGCSLSDPNLRRLLDVASRSNEKPRHYAIMRKPKITKCGGIKKQDIDTYKKIDMNIREKCFAAMGINIIWIDDYKQIKEILNWVKN